MKYLLLLLVFLGCGRKGDTDRPNKLALQNCAVDEDKAICAGVIYTAETCQPEIVIESPDVIVNPPDVIVNVPEADTPQVEVDVEVLLPDYPPSINYRGYVCDNLQAVEINEFMYIVHRNAINLIDDDTWVTIWQKTKHGETDGCYARLDAEGALEINYVRN